jgi:quercetin dioxygenase-like cupin family protein
MQQWDLRTCDVQPHQPQILDSERGESRSILINLPAGEKLQEHEVHERAHLVVIDGDVEIARSGEVMPARAGTLAVFRPHERHEVRASSDSRLLLVLAPWPGDGHPGARDHDG